MSSGAALRRLKKEYATLDNKERPPGVLIVRPLETNFLHAHFLLAGEAFYDTPYEGGVYHGVLKFPTNYPMGPPSVIMRTPSGRFQPDKKICFSMSDFHKEQWNPMWNIGTILTGLVSFMNGEDITTGGMRATASARRQFAQKSLQHNMQQDALAKELFASALEEVVAERTKHGNVWPPVRPPPVQPTKPAAAASMAKRASRRPKRAKSKAVSSDANEAGEEAESESAVAAETIKPPDTTGKNAAKNKKKREREKRKKLARTFLTNLRQETPPFLDAVLAALDALQVNVSQYPADHVCWRTESMEEYSDLVAALRGAATDDTRLLIESEIGGRSIATFELLEPIQCSDGRSVSVVEIPAPKDGRPYKRGLEHVEFVIGDEHESDGQGGVARSSEAQKLVLQEFMNKYPSIEWNTKAIDKPVNADVSMQVELQDQVCSVKFHLMPLSKVIEFEKEDCAVVN